MDLILGYPADEIAFIGLFMTNIHDQNKGVGSNIIGDVCNYLGQLGYQKVRIGVDKGNPQSNSFWKKNGFYMISEKEYHVMELLNLSSGLFLLLIFVFSVLIFKGFVQ